MEERDWCDLIKGLRAIIEEIQYGIDRCQEEGIPEALEANIEGLGRAASEAQNSISELFALVCSEPTARFLTGLPLCREQYYLVRATGSDILSAYVLGLSPVLDHVLLAHLCYEDDHQRCYINPHAQVRKERIPGEIRLVGLRFGRPPEELSRAALRPDQAAFLKEHLPEVYERFAP